MNRLYPDRVYESKRTVVDNNDFLFFSGMFFFTFFFPSFHLYVGSAGAIIINALSILLIGTFFLFRKYRYSAFSWKDRTLLFYVAVYYIFFLMHIALSSLIGVVFGGVDIIERDLFEIHRPVLYYLTFAFSFCVFRRASTLKGLEHVLLAIFVMLIFFGLNHFLRGADYLSSLYTKESNIVSRRVSTPFVNPYDYAFVVSFYIFYFFIKSLYGRKWHFLLFGLALILFILPQSRSVMIGFLMGFTVFTPCYLVILNIKPEKLLIGKPLLRFGFVFVCIIAAFLMSIPYLLDNFTYLTYQFVQLIRSGDIGSSAGSRLDQFMFALDKAQNPIIFLLGNGPAKSEMEYVESIYNYQFYRYGLVGLVLYYVLPMSAGLYMSNQCRKFVGRNSPEYPIYVAIFLWLLTVPLMMIGNNFTEQVRISFFYYSLLGILTARYYFYVSAVSKLDRNKQ